MSGPAFAASIFDMDGLLVDSEPLWHEAEVEILGGLGVPLAASDCRQTKGMFVGEVTRFWHERFPWPSPDPDTVAREIVDAVGSLVLAKGRLQPGVDRALATCRRHGLPLAVASSTEYRLIDLVLAHFGLADEFVVVHSAEDEPYGKPHPGVFLTTASELDVAPDRCLVFEDAPAGVLAAKAARMACVAVPEPAERDRPAFALADAVLVSLAEVDDALFEQLVARHWADPMAAPGAH
ncbi:MAG TPA: hexitol phosphatase HxpB [Acidimicrobiales bacterium]|nr:hexitol phosphatase HxpB [Acidimicrobiales bacterium]